MPGGQRGQEFREVSVDVGGQPGGLGTDFKDLDYYCQPLEAEHCRKQTCCDSLAGLLMAGGALVFALEALRFLRGPGSFS